MFDAIIFDPASPNPKASKWPILTIAFSKIAVSYYASCPAFLPFFYWVAIVDKIPADSTSSEAAAKGFFAINFTFSNILSIGPSTNVLASLVNIIDAIDNTRHTKIVLLIESIASISVYAFIEKNAIN